MTTGRPRDRRPGRYEVADLTLAAQGRRAIDLAAHEMPGLVALRDEYGPARPLAGARITGSLHMTVQTAVLIETLLDLGAKVRWASCNIFSTQDEAAAAVVVGRGGTPDDPVGPPVFAWRGESLQDYWRCTVAALDWPGGGPTAIVDDGADASAIVHAGLASEAPGWAPTRQAADSPDGREMLRAVRRMAGQWARIGRDVRGISEETTTGVMRLTQLATEGTLRFPVIDVNDAVTKSKFDNRYGIRHSLVDGLNRATDLLIGGKVAFVCGYGDVGKGAAEALRGQGARVIVAEVDPICALQAAMDGFQVARLEDVVTAVDFVVTCTGGRDAVRVEHMARMRDKAVVANVGHFDNEIDMAGLEAVEGIKRSPVKDRVDEWVFPDGHSVIVLSEGRLANLGNATGHPSFVMSTSFANQVLAQIEVATAPPGTYGRQVYRLAKALDEKVARLHLPALGAVLT
ncbi:MAG: adenosylhomocysteinase, partial [Bifidobacteriaceae bacterium]|nr:adenosylhomocysteinase [Bifidobacteriaceae bacterium]